MHDHCSARLDLVRVRALVRLAARQRDARQRVALGESAHRHVGAEVARVSARRALG